MILLAMLFVAVFLLVSGAIAACVLLCCQPGMRRVDSPVPLVQPSWAVAKHEQNWNTPLSSLSGYRQFSVLSVWPSARVSPGIPANQALSAATAHGESQHEGFLQQRRYLSEPARRVIVHGGSR